MVLAAFHNDASIKALILAQIKLHREHDDLVRGQYWENGKGCAVGCALESIRVAKGLATIDHGSHAQAAAETDTPEMLWHLCDCIFENVPNRDAQVWPERFVSAIRPGADLSRVGWQFLHWLLTDSAVNPGIKDPIVCDAVRQCADVLVPLTKGEIADESEAMHAASAAARAACAAMSTASAADGAVGAARAAARVAESAACAARAAESAESEAESEASAACAAWCAADSAANAAGAAWIVAWSATHLKMTDKLLSLMEAV